MRRRQKKALGNVDHVSLQIVGFGPEQRFNKNSKSFDRWILNRSTFVKILTRYDTRDKWPENVKICLINTITQFCWKKGHLTKQEREVNIKKISNILLSKVFHDGSSSKSKTVSAQIVAVFFVKGLRLFFLILCTWNCAKRLRLTFWHVVGKKLYCTYRSFRFKYVAS